MTTDKINRHSKVPFYHQLYEILHNRVIKGEWKPGDMIPAEIDLVEAYKVSRNTVRQVMSRLVDEGFIYRQRGRGSFVSHPSLEHSMSRIISFTEDMHQRGFEPGTQLLNAQLIPASIDIAEKLHILPGEELALIARLRLADGEPMSIEESHLVHNRCPNVICYDFSRSPLRQVLSHDYGIRLVYARQVIRAILSIPEQSRLLKILPRSPLLQIERVSYSQDDIPIEFLKIFYRSDRYSLYNELHD